MSLHLAAVNDLIDPPSAVAMLKALPFAVYTTDPEGRITAFNEAAVEMWGREPQLGEYWCGSHKLYWPDGRAMAHQQCPMAETLKTGVAVRGAEAILERPDGRRIHFAPYPTALKDAAGRITGGINILVDITERIHADRTKGHLAALVESSDDAIISKDLDGIIRSWNKGAERIFGYTEEETVGRHVSLLIPPERQNEEPGIIERIRRGERIEHYETVRQRKDGSKIDISLTVSPVKDARGQVVGASKIARDITDRKRAEAIKELLLHEIKHRVKNTLGTVQAIANQTFRDGPKQERNAFSGRLRALSNAHDLLTRQDWDQVSLQDMIRGAVAPFEESRAERVQVWGEEVILKANKALLLAMAIHELATNAVKYGALSNASGTVALTWRIQGAGETRTLALEWRESGGPAVGAPARKGFGSTLIERALHQEQGRSCIEFRPEGVRCMLEMKV
ncbi:MAG TPA: PAS domain S-box protein [Rhizomicrobium sp.]|nr:PAS domain S-box protein [Rhizomicrobium sp.]